MKKKFKTIVIVLLILFAVWNLLFFLFGRTSAEMIQYGALENSFGVTGYVFKDEIVIEGVSGGVLKPTVSDGERVHKGARIGAVLSADTDESALNEYLRIEDRLSRLKSSKKQENYDETIRTDEQITEISYQSVRAAESGDMEKLASLKEKLLVAKDEKTALGGQYDDLQQRLTQRQAALREKIGSSMKEVYSPEAGILYLQTDGMEREMQTDKTENLTPSALKEIAARAGNYDSGCKLVRSDGWKIACIVDAEKAEGLSEGQAVSLRFYEQGGETGKVIIESVSETENGECVLVFSGTKAPHGFMQCRKVTLDVILSRYEGLKVPKKAITEENGETGVFVQTITKRTFKKTEVSYEGETYAIVAEGKNTELRLYDTVLY